MKYKLVMIMLFSAVALCGCSPDDFFRNKLNRIAQDEDEVFAKECLSALRVKDLKTVKKQFDPQFVTTGIESNLTRAARMLAHGEPVSVELVGCNTFSAPDQNLLILTYQYQFTNAWALASVTVNSDDGVRRVWGLNVVQTPKSLQEINAFTLSGKSVLAYVTLAFAVVIPVFIGWVVILCARSKVRMKWLWILFIFIGIMRINLNWTTGTMIFQPVTILIPGAGVATMGLYAPWIVTVSFPLGAILFLFKQRWLRSRQNENVISHDLKRD